MRMYTVAQEVVASDSKDAMVSKKTKFIDVLEEFCAETIVMNREFTSKVLIAHQNIVCNPPRSAG